MADITFIQIASETLRTGADLVTTSGRDVIGLGTGRYVSDALANAALFAAHPRFVARSSNGRYFRALPDAGRVPVELGGAKGDRIADDGPAICTAFAYASAIGAAGVSFSGSKYRMEPTSASEGTFPAGPVSMLLPSSGGIIDFGGAALVRQIGGTGFVHAPGYGVPFTDFPLGADVAAGSTVVTLAAAPGAALAVGDAVLWQLGEIPYDKPETLNWNIATVIAINGAAVSLDRLIPQAMELVNVTGVNKRLRKLTPLRDTVIRDFTLTSAGQECAMYLYGAQRVRVERVGGRNFGAGVVICQYCDGLTIEDCWQEGSMLAGASHGPAFSFAECRNVVMTRPRATNTLGLLGAEPGAEITVICGQLENTITDSNGASRGNTVAACTAVGQASITMQDLTVTGYGGYRLAEVSNGVAGYDGSVQFTGVTRLEHPTQPFSAPIEWMSGKLDITIAGVREIYDFDRLRPWKRRFALRDNEYANFFGPPGVLVRARAYASPGLAIGAGQQLTGVWVGRGNQNGFNLVDVPFARLTAGTDIRIPCFAGEVGGTQWQFRNEPFKVLVTTTAGSGLDTANEFVEIECWFAQLDKAVYGLSEAAARGAGDGREVLEASFPGNDLPLIAAQDSLTLDLPIPDMLASDFIDAVRFGSGFGGLALRSAEARAASVRLVIANPGAAPIDLAATEIGIAFSRSILGS